MEDVFDSSPLRQYAPPHGPQGHRDSGSSTHSTQSANSFPTYGLIKVSNTDQGSSCDSFSLVSPQGSAYWNNNEMRGSPTSRKPSLGAVSQSRTTNPFHDGADTDPKTPMTPKTPIPGSSATFGKPLDTRQSVEVNQVLKPRKSFMRPPLDEHNKALQIPSEPFDRVRYLLDRIVTAHHSDHGVYLTGRFFISKEVFLQSHLGIPNGSVKIGIIQEVTSLLKKFVDGDESTSLGAVEATLHYYEKLMEAFGVFAPVSEEQATDSNSVVTSAASHLKRLQIERAESLDALTTPTESNNTQSSPLDHTESSVSVSSNEQKHKHRNSFAVLGKFKGKMKRRSVLSLDQQLTSQSSTSSPHLLLNTKSKEQLRDPNRQSQSTPTHTRSVSTATTVTTASSSSRSMRDVCTLQEYMSLLEKLHAATNETYGKLGPQPNDNEALEKVVLFMDSHVIAFIMRDVTQLALSFMKDMIQDYC